jgi:hypothetical protein
MNKRELLEENERLRERLEEAYDTIGDALGFDDDSESEEGDGEDEDGESDASEFNEEE